MVVEGKTEVFHLYLLLMQGGEPAVIRINRSIFEYQQSSGSSIQRPLSDWRLTVAVATRTSQPFRK